MASLSIIIPALNEEKNIKAAILAAVAAAQDILSDYEVLVFDDGSTDKTGDIAEQLSRENPKIRVIHNGTNKGFGYNYRRGVEMALCEYVTLHPGDNEHPEETVRNLFREVGKADIVVAYHGKPHLRGLFRRFLSDGYTRFVNTLFGLEVSYYNGPNILRREMLQKVPMTTDSFAYMTEILLQLIVSGADFVEVGFIVRRRTKGSTKAFKPSNLINSMRTVFRLWWELIIQGRRLNIK